MAKQTLNVELFEPVGTETAPSLSREAVRAPAWEALLPDVRRQTTETAPGLDREAVAPVRRAATLHDFAHYSYAPSVRPAGGMGRLWSNIGRWVIAISAATAPVGYFIPAHEFRRSLASSIVSTVRRRRGQPISLQEARNIAFAVLRATEQRLQEERTSEAKFLLALWEEQGPMAE